MQFLVTGGAGYIGSHIVRALASRGDRVTILDNFSTGHRWATQGQEVVEADLRDLPALRGALAGRRFDGVFHFAARSLVGESNTAPLLYYQNNVSGTANLLEVAAENGWRNCVFSSTAAIYGTPEAEFIDEQHPRRPINVYGQTKLAMEQLLEALAAATDFNAVSLRYFNAAGAAGDGSIGEAHDPETHLIPNALRAAAGTGEPLTLFGDDYDTRDGTCIRDYIHVEDLAGAHLLAMDFLREHTGFSAINLGSGGGFSVREVIAACETIVGAPLAYRVGPRRTGDPAVLVASNRRARDWLGWGPRQAAIETMVASAWRWEQERARVTETTPAAREP
ncbi:MAG TPA: UDP-glucose 4-epimerase GalE [Pseudohaliea sp.]|nr:UDP-glucose 4-epimerase GalE [Pseudohaliea sp.]